MTCRSNIMSQAAEICETSGGPAVVCQEEEQTAKRRREKGFTLVELLVVLIILGLIAAFVAPQVIKYLGKAKTDSAAIQIQRLSGILDLYHLEAGRYPTTEEGLQALIEQPVDAESWNGPYIKKADSLMDPWGRSYEYRSPGEHGAFDLFTLGRDGSDGGDGEDQDITSW